MNPFEAYQLYSALKLHFTTPYDYFKYNGKTNVTFDAFNRRRDKFQYNKLSKQRDPQGFIVANFISDCPPKWIGDLNTDEANERYVQFLARTQSLTYRFDTEVRGLSRPLVSGFKTKNGQFPEVLVKFRHGDISIETLTILNNHLNVFPIWDKKINDTILWPSMRDRCLNYQPFLKYDVGKIKGILADVMAEVTAI